MVIGSTTDVIGQAAGANGITLLELAAQRGSLEEAFMKLTGGDVQYHAAGVEEVMGGAL